MCSDEENLPEYNEKIFQGAVYENLYESMQAVNVGLMVRSNVLSASLDIPNIYNAGHPGYCWLCAAVGICVYYGHTVDMSVAHNYAHNTYHMLLNCTGGTLQEALNVMNHFAGVNGTIINDKLTYYQVMVEIRNGRPIFSGWLTAVPNSADGTINYYGHAMVICGFLYNTQYGTFVYKLRDSNLSDYQYVYTNISDTVVDYVIGNYTFEWETTIYDIE